MTSFHTITGHLFNRNISKEELNKSDSLLSTLKQQPNLNILGVWTIDSKQEKKLKKLNALAKKMRHYRGSSQAKRERIGKLVSDIRSLNAKLIGASSTPNNSPRPSCTPSSTTAQSNSGLSHLHETSSTLSTASTARSSLELSEPSRYGAQGQPKIKVAVTTADNSTVGKPAAALSVTPETDTTGNQTKSIHAQIADKKDELSKLELKHKETRYQNTELEPQIKELKREIRTLSQKAAAEAAVSRATHAPSRATQVTDANGSTKPPLGAKLVRQRTTSLAQLQSQLTILKNDYASKKDESRGSSRAYKDFEANKQTLKHEIQVLESQIKALQSS